MRRAPEVRLVRGERARLLALAESAATPRRLAQRAQIALLASQGRSDRLIAGELGTDPGTVARWRRRFLVQRLAGLLKDAPRSGRPPTISTSKIQVILRSTLGRRPPGGGYWSARSLAREVGVSKTTVQRVWKAHGLEPRRATETFRPNPGAGFVEQITDLVGLYMDLPERAMVFSVDARTHSPSRVARARRAESEAEERRRGREFLAFLHAVDRETPRGLDLHLLVDSRLTPAEPEVHRWLVRHPRFFLHFVPPGPGRANVMERWFAQFLRRRVGPQAFPSVARLHRAIRDHFASQGGASRPFVWTSTAEEIRDRTGRPGAEHVGPNRPRPVPEREPQ
jgi:transposase